MESKYLKALNLLKNVTNTAKTQISKRRRIGSTESVEDFQKPEINEEGKGTTGVEVVTQADAVNKNDGGSFVKGKKRKLSMSASRPSVLTEARMLLHDCLESDFFETTEEDDIMYLGNDVEMLRRKQLKTYILNNLSLAYEKSNESFPAIDCLIRSLRINQNQLSA